MSASLRKQTQAWQKLKVASDVGFFCHLPKLESDEVEGGGGGGLGGGGDVKM